MFYTNRLVDRLEDLVEDDAANCFSRYDDHPVSRRRLKLRSSKTLFLLQTTEWKAV